MKALIIIALSMFLSCAGPQVVGQQSDGYKSIVDLYPKQAEAAGVLQLGEVEEIEGSLLRTFAECKSVKTDSWFQFYDIAENGEFDNEADFAVFIVLYKDQFKAIEVFTADEAIKIITDHCKKYNIEIQGFIHYADPVRIRYDNEI